MNIRDRFEDNLALAYEEMIDNPVAAAVALTTEELVYDIQHDRSVETSRQQEAMCHFHDHELAKAGGR